MRNARGKKLAGGIAVAAVLIGGGTAAALTTTAGTATARTVAATSATPVVPASSPLGALVARGTITRAQADAVHNALYTYMRAHRQEVRDHRSATTPPMLATNGPLQTVLGQLVENHTISQAQATAITSAITEQVREHWRNGPGAGYGPGRMAGYGPGRMAGYGPGAAGYGPGAAGYGPGMMGGSPWAGSSSS